MIARLRRTAILYVVYLATGLALLPGYRHRVSVDTTSYISIAELYARGDFAAAVNSHWGPLFSWLIAGSMRLGVDPLVACRLIMLASGLALLEAARRILAQLEVSAALALGTLTALAILALGWVLAGVVYPDVLFTALLTCYLAAAVRPPSAGSGVACGVFGGLAYLAKSFALPFFLAHFALAAAWRILRSRAALASTLASAAAGLAFFALIVLPWVAALSARHERLTFGTAGRYNVNLMGPANPGHPLLRAGLVPPPREGAYSAWEQPLLPMPHWNPLESLSSFAHFLNIIGTNLPTLFESFARTSYLSFVIVPIALFLCLRRGMPGTLPAGLMLAAGLLFVAAFSVLLVRPRYLWPVSVIVLLLAAWVLHEVRRLPLPRPARGALVALVLASFCIWPVRQLVENWQLGRELPRQANALRAMGVSGRIASNDFNGSLFMCYHLRASCYGVPRMAAGDESIRQELAKHRIEHFLLYGKADAAPPWLEAYRFLPGGPAGIQVYRRAAQ